MILVLNVEEIYIGGFIFFLELLMKLLNRKYLYFLKASCFLLTKINEMKL